MGCQVLLFFHGESITILKNPKQILTHILFIPSYVPETDNAPTGNLILFFSEIENKD